MFFLGLFDICRLEDPLPEADVVIAADVMYEPATGRAMAHRTAEAHRRGSRVIIGCSPGRPGRPIFERVLRDLLGGDGGGVMGDFFDVEGTTCSGPRHELICGNESTSVSDVPKMLPIALMDLPPHES